jgi:hypothetical protein
MVRCFAALERVRMKWNQREPQTRCAPSPRVQPNSGLPEFGKFIDLPKSETSDFGREGWGEGDSRLADYVESPPHPPRFARRPLPASGERLGRGVWRDCASISRRCASATLAVLLWGLAPAAWATGPLGPEIRFFSRSGQDPVDDLAFFRGQLGILRPTFTDNRLYAAYRIMLGGRFSEAQARQLLARCCDAPETPSDAMTSWNDLRKRVAGVPPAKESSGFRQRPEDMQLFDVSCFPNAYRNSAATLRARIAEHGANSPLVRDWVIGQDAVLLNCYEDSSLPEEPPRNAPAWLKADLAYQIAAAYFYRLDYARAGQLFAQIGRDASSPWQKTARYLVARCAVHAAIENKTPKLIADAQQAIDALATDPQLADYRADAPKLASLLAFATRPQERARELERTLLAPDLPPTLPVDLRDFLLLERSGARNTDLGAWIYDIDILTTSGREQDVAAAKTDALTRWREQRNLPWLVAALMHLAPGDEDVAAAIAASRAIEAGSPAYYTLAWNRLRLLIADGKQDEARAELDQILDGRPLPEGVENLMRYHRMKLARDLDEFVRFALRRGEFVMYLPDPRTKLDATPPPLSAATRFPYDFGAMLKWRTELFHSNPRYFDEDATAALSFFTPLSIMARVVQSERLPPNVQRDVALAVWTRAVLLEDAETANAVGPIVARYFPQYGAGWKTYQSAATPQQKKIEAALLLLRLPGASPWFASGLGYPYMRDVIGLVATRWWEHVDADNQAAPDAADNITLCDDCALPLQFAAPAFLTSQDRDRARDEAVRLRQLPGAPAYLGAIIIAWANAQPRDPRVPEALHLVVRATRYGEKNTATSKAAYTLLHDRYRRNSWTSKTPLWFTAPGDE